MWITNIYFIFSNIESKILLIQIYYIYDIFLRLTHKINNNIKIKLTINDPISIT